MTSYKIFYENIQIGVLQINEKGQHKYLPDKKGTEKVMDNISIFHDLLIESDWRDPIPFFENRIRDAKKFSKEDYISNQTDPFKFVKDKN